MHVSDRNFNDLGVGIYFQHRVIEQGFGFTQSVYFPQGDLQRATFLEGVRTAFFFVPLIVGGGGTQTCSKILILKYFT